jgi:hypothetical protein
MKVIHSGQQANAGRVGSAAFVVVADYMGAGFGPGPFPAQPGSATLRVSDELGKEAR